MKRRYVIIAIAIIAILSVGVFILCLHRCTCEQDSIFPSTTNTTETTETMVVKKTEIVEETDYFRITQAGMLFYYELYGADHNVVFSDGPYTKPPRITMVEKQLMRITTQAGTGIGTHSGFYYDVETGATSSLYSCIFDQSCGLVAYATYDTIFVRDIFDEQGFYQEISTFEQPFSQVAFPFTDVRFSENGYSVYVSFLSGPEYTEVTQEFSLNTEDCSLSKGYRNGFAS